MTQNVYVFDPTASDEKSRVRGVGRYLQLLKENFPDWIFTDKLPTTNHQPPITVFINPFFNFLQPPLTMRRIAQKQIAVIHDLIPLKYPEHFPSGIKGSLNIFLNKLALKNYDLVITDSQASKKDIVQMLKVDENRVKVTYPCLPKSFINSQYVMRNKAINQLSDDGLRITDYCLYVGDVTWNKNLVNLAKAIKIADVNCVFVGKVFEKLVGVASEVTLRETDGLDGVADRASQERRDHERQAPQIDNNTWLNEFNEFVELTKGDKRFIFKGFITDYELVKLYQQVKINILVSRDEGFGFSYLEAGQFGCPSLLSDISTLKEISADQGAVFAYPNDPEDIAKKLKNLMNDQDLRNTLSSEAQEQAKYFNQKNFKKDWLKIIIA